MPHARGSGVAEQGVSGRGVHSVVQAEVTAAVLAAVLPAVLPAVVVTTASS